MRDSDLLFALPGDEIAAQEKTVISDRFSSISTFGPISIGISNQVRTRRGKVIQPMMKSAFQVFQNTQSTISMMKTRLANKMTKIIHSMTNIGFGKVNIK